MFRRIKDFLNQVYLEMNKVSWPSYNELRGSTYLIIVFFLLFVLFTSKVNPSIANVNSYVIEFFEDSLSFLLFQTEEKPFPFKNNSEEEVVIEAEEIEDSSSK